MSFSEQLVESVNGGWKMLHQATKLTPWRGGGPPPFAGVGDDAGYVVRSKVEYKEWKKCRKLDSKCRQVLMV